ncbi:MAG: hypothetical protein ACYC0V_10615 [Armatimonadota bacterium]
MSKKVMGVIVLLLMMVIPSFGIGQDGEVIIGQQLILRIRFAAGGYSIQQRADAVTVRLNEYLGVKPFNPSMVKVANVNGEYCVMIGSDLIITADKDTARYNQATPKQLAEMWASNIRRVLPKAKAEKDG